MKNLYILIVFLSLRTIAQTPTIDNTFNTNDNGIYDQYIGKFSAAQPDGKLLSFYYDLEKNVTKIIRLNINGDIDNTFNFTEQYDRYYLPKIFVKPDGKFLTVLSLESTNTATIKSYNADGTANNNFISPTFLKNDSSIDATVNYIIYQNDGKITIGGTFNKVNNIFHYNMVRLNSDGTIDNTFLASVGSVGNIAMQNDGKYVVGVDISSYSGTILRLNSNGTLDNSFQFYLPASAWSATNGFDYPIKKIIIQTDGKIVACGASFYLNGQFVSNDIVRLNNNGTPDFSFKYYNFNEGHDMDYFCIQNDGKYIINLSDYKKCTIGRLNTDGTIDKTFVYSNTECSEPGDAYLQNGRLY